MTRPSQFQWLSVIVRFGSGAEGVEELGLMPEICVSRILVGGGEPQEGGCTGLATACVLAVFPMVAWLLASVSPFDRNHAEPITGGQTRCVPL